MAESLTAIYDLATLPSVALAERASLPDAPGIYIVHTPSEVLYVGRALSLVKRWRYHQRFTQFAAFDGARIAIYRAEAHHLDNLEWQYIHLLRPALNVANTPYEGRRRDGERNLEVRLTVDARRKLTAAADRLGITQAQVVFEAIRQFDVDRYAEELVANRR